MRLVGQQVTRPLGLCLVMAAMILLARPASAAQAGTDPDGTRACIDPARSTADDMAQCLDGVRVAADARLTATYAEALRSLDEPDRAALRDAQRAWVAFRAKDWQSLTGPWRAKRSLTVRVDAAAADIGAINAREVALRVYRPSSP